MGWGEEVIGRVVSGRFGRVGRFICRRRGVSLFGMVRFELLG